MNIYAMKKPKRINAVSISFFFLALIFGYIGWAVVEIYGPIFQLSGIMRGACNDAYRNTSDEQVMNKLLKDSQRTGLPLTKDNFRFTRIPYSEEELQVLTKGNQSARAAIAARGKTCKIEMRYANDFKLPLLDKTVHIPFEKTVVASLEQVKYDKMCTCVTVPES